MSPWFLEYFDFLNNINIFGDYEKVYNYFITYHDNNPEGLYFLNNTSELYINSMASNILFLLMGKLLRLIFNLLKDRCKHKIFRKMYVRVSRITKWWSLITMIIQGNLVVIVFQCSLQLLALVSLEFANKLNMIICVLFFFATFFYAVSFYPLIYKYEKKGAASTLLNYSFYGGDSYMFESMAFLLRTVTRSMIQGLTFQNY